MLGWSGKCQRRHREDLDKTRLTLMTDKKEKKEEEETVSLWHIAEDVQCTHAAGEWAINRPPCRLYGPWQEQKDAPFYRPRRIAAHHPFQLTHSWLANTRSDPLRAQLNGQCHWIGAVKWALVFWPLKKLAPTQLNWTEELIWRKVYLIKLETSAL